MKTIAKISCMYFLLVGCQGEALKDRNGDSEKAQMSLTVDSLTSHLKPINDALPTIGLLMYTGVLITELTATADVFTKPSEDGRQLFNVLPTP